MRSQLFERRITLSVPRDRDEIHRGGRPRKGSKPSPTKLRRVDILLSQRDLERIEEIRAATDAETITDVIRDALWVHAQLIEAQSGRQEPMTSQRRTRRK